MALLGRAVPPILLLLEGKGKGSHAYDSMAIRRLRPFSHARILVLRVGYLVFGFLAVSFLAGGGVLRDGVERLRGVVCPSYGNCGGRFGSASGDGLGGCIC